jgi:hypothetical protein
MIYYMTEHIIYSTDEPGLDSKLSIMVANRASITDLTIPANAQYNEAIFKKLRKLKEITTLTIDFTPEFPPETSFPPIAYSFKKLERLIIKHPIREVQRIDMTVVPNLKYISFILTPTADIEKSIRGSIIIYGRKGIRISMYVPPDKLESARSYMKTLRHDGIDNIEINATTVDTEEEEEEDNAGMAGMGAPPHNSAQEEKGEGVLQEEKDEPQIPITPPPIITKILPYEQIRKIKFHKMSFTSGIIEYNTKNKVVVIHEVLSNIQELLDEITTFMNITSINALIIEQKVSRFNVSRSAFNVSIIQCYNFSKHIHTDVLLPYTKNLFHTVIVPRLHAINNRTKCKQLYIDIRHNTDEDIQAYADDIIKFQFFEKLECHGVNTELLKIYKQRYPLSHVVGISDVIYERPKIEPLYDDVVNNVHIFNTTDAIIYDKGITYENGNSMLEHILQHLDSKISILTICGYVYTELPELSRFTELDTLILVNTAIINFNNIMSHPARTRALRVIIENEHIKWPESAFIYDSVVPKIIYDGSQYINSTKTIPNICFISNKYTFSYLGDTTNTRPYITDLIIQRADAMKYVLKHPFFSRTHIDKLTCSGDANEGITRPITGIKHFIFHKCNSIKNIEMVKGVEQIQLDTIKTPITSFDYFMNKPHVIFFNSKFAINFPLEFKPKILVIDICTIPNIDEYKQHVIDNYDSNDMAFKLDGELILKKICHSDFQLINNEYMQNAMRLGTTPPIHHTRIDMAYPTPDDRILPIMIHKMSYDLMTLFISGRIKLISGRVVDAGGLTAQFMTQLTTQLNAFAEQGESVLTPLPAPTTPSPSSGILSSVHEFLPPLNKMQLLKRNCSFLLYLVHMYNHRDYITNITLENLVTEIPDFDATISPIYYQYIGRVVLNIPFKHLRHILTTPNGKKNILILYSRIMNDPTGQEYTTFKNDYDQSKGQMYFGRSGVMKGGKINKSIKRRNRRRNRTLKGGSSSSDDNYSEMIEFAKPYTGIYNIPMLKHLFNINIMELRGKMDGIQLYYLLNPSIREISAEDIQYLLANIQYPARNSMPFPEHIRQFFINIIQDYKAYITDPELINKYESQHEFLTKLLFYWSSNKTINKAMIRDGNKYKIFADIPRHPIGHPDYPQYLFKAATCFTSIHVITPTFNQLYAQENGINEIFRILTFMIDSGSMNVEG